MKKFLPVTVAVILFFACLELFSRLYFFRNSESWVGSLEHQPQSVLQIWRGLPYEIPVKDGELVRYTKKGTVVFRVPFRINENSTRASSKIDGEILREILFIGCSFTFGTGVRDHETLSSYVGKNFKGSRTHNYGMTGATTVETLLRLRKVDQKEFSSHEKLVVYTFIGDHLRRHALVIPYVGGWGKDKQVFRRNGNDFEALGKYRDAHPLRSYLFRLLSGSGLFFALYPYFDLQLTDDEKNEFLTSVEFMKKHSQSIGGKFLVLIWPGTQLPGWLLRGMNDKEISYLNLSQVKLHKFIKSPYLPVDSHPTPEAYKVVGDLLISHLKKNHF